MNQKHGEYLLGYLKGNIKHSTCSQELYKKLPNQKKSTGNNYQVIKLRNWVEMIMWNESSQNEVRFEAVRESAVVALTLE